MLDLPDSRASAARVGAVVRGLIEAFGVLGGEPIFLSPLAIVKSP